MLTLYGISGSPLIPLNAHIFFGSLNVTCFFGLVDFIKSANGKFVSVWFEKNARDEG